MEMEKPSAFDPRGQSDVDPRKLFYFDPSKVLTGGVIFILPCLLAHPDFSVAAPTDPHDSISKGLSSHPYILQTLLRFSSKCT